MRPPAYVSPAAEEANRKISKPSAKSLDQYFSAASTTIHLLSRNGTSHPLLSAMTKTQCRRACSDNAGPKMIQVSLAWIVSWIPSRMWQRTCGTKALKRFSRPASCSSEEASSSPSLNLFLTKPPQASRPGNGTIVEPDPEPLRPAMPLSVPPTLLGSLQRSTASVIPPDSSEQLLLLPWRERLPCPCRQAGQGDMHDPHAVQGEDPVADCLAHSSNLSISSFRQHDPEPSWPEAFRETRLGLASQDDDSRRETVQHRLIIRAIHRDLVFTLMPELCPQDLVHDVAVIGEENQAGRVLVEPADRKDPFRMADLSDDIARNVGFARRRDAYRLVIFDVDARP